MGFLKLYMMDVNRWIERQFHVKTKVAYLSAMFARLAIHCACLLLQSHPARSRSRSRLLFDNMDMSTKIDFTELIEELVIDLT